MSSVTVEKRPITQGSTPVSAVSTGDSTPTAIGSSVETTSTKPSDVKVGAKVDENAPGPGRKLSGEIHLKVPMVGVVDTKSGRIIDHPKYHTEMPSRRNEHYHYEGLGHVIVNVLKKEADEIVKKYKDAKIVNETS